MVKITNTGNKPRHFRGASGFTTLWLPGETLDINDEGLLRLVSRHKEMVEQKEVGATNVGAGLKTGVRRPKSNSKAPRAEPKEEVDCPKGSYKCKGACKCDTIKKPKGLKKSKRAD